MMKYEVHSLQETAKVAVELAKTLKGGEVIAFTGSMGAGKTAFTRELVKALGGGDIVSSPTFAIINEYAGKIPVKHFDMYRIQSFDDLYSTGFFDYQDDFHSVLIIEWSENITDFLPKNVIKIDISFGKEENHRIIAIERQEG
ncbi:tRNA (adenosine(37)-N6)-threonylcarbamoyltransferase complex ATPase subunit type 1 TsaE [Scatolibacter rhodanostii]|uniref:tRNA (adenosine(37)-N6)-threonylcarbamoyltransferase complex ATPase subunit type 1 TsaE n=1 Tax=Scatolibacter rhodanostii TaxID=2014781 RepID=UPI000C084F27|nr:tRNA (adenosine(37)-N6)-threonylcarbamoyltransferase complex ATPase subunit type 1 TsaE [Scatolibacter rhodanostii]